jgi:hypothetical protein
MHEPITPITPCNPCNPSRRTTPGRRGPTRGGGSRANIGLELTASSVRSAPASRRSSGRAFGARGRREKTSRQKPQTGTPQPQEQDSLPRSSPKAKQPEQPSRRRGRGANQAEKPANQPRQSSQSRSAGAPRQTHQEPAAVRRTAVVGLPRPPVPVEVGPQGRRRRVGGKAHGEEGVPQPRVVPCSAPNKRLQPTPYSARCAPASGRG